MAPGVSGATACFRVRAQTPSPASARAQFSITNASTRSMWGTFAR